MYTINSISNRKKAICCALAIYAAGFATHMEIGRNEDYQIKEDTITYKGKVSRPVYVHSGKIIVGTTKERLSDLLLESPHTIRSAIQEILAEQGKSFK